jgi:hypothetical protein
MYAMLDAVDTVLFVPQFAEGAMELQVTLMAIDPEGVEAASVDRWRIYHGEPQDARWARLDLDAARHDQMVIDGEALSRPNPLRSDEARLCREINQNQRDELRRVCQRCAGADVEEPILVGIDANGFDVRRRFDVIRVRSTEPMRGGEDVQRVFRQMADG